MKTTNERVKSILKKRDDYINKKKREGYMAITCISLSLVFALMIGGATYSPNSIFRQYDNENVAVNSEKESELLAFNSKEELIKAMKKSEAYKNSNRDYYRFGLTIDDAIVYNANAVAPTSVERAEAKTETTAYSETNVQVKGVDEADIIKTDGKYIYYLNNNILRVFDNTKEKIEIIKEIKFSEDYKGNYAYELYLTDEYLVVVTNSGFMDDIVYNSEEEKVKSWNYYPRRNSTKLMIFDTKCFELTREVETEGNYISSRIVDNDIYLITNKSLYYSNFKDDEIIPLYRDTCVNHGNVSEVEIDSIRCFPSFTEDSECSYMIITSMSLDRLNEKANVDTFIGTGSEVYCSKDNLYVTKTKYYSNYKNGVIRFVEDLIAVDPEKNEEDKTETIIRKFAIKDGSVKYVAEGAVPGSPLNQFSMDEYDGNFRITTTRGNTWDESSLNNLYVLDSELNIIGKIENLAKGEKIYSTRFMGDKCYVVTYKTVDPLFVLDLSNPKNPKVQGELKIPGYSRYLHPLGENYLIGFGEDSIEKTVTNYDGSESVTAYSTGLKLAIFDVSDMNNPKEISSVKIGGRGSRSELLDNHKTLLWKEDEGLFAFPVSLYEENAGYYENGVPMYGKREFDGFVVFDISAKDGIVLRGKIQSEQVQKSYDSNPKRIIFIGDKLYSFFGNMLKINDLETIKELDKITF